MPEPLVLFLDLLGFVPDALGFVLQLLQELLAFELAQLVLLCLLLTIIICLLLATHEVSAAARWPDPAARGGRTWASACSILHRRSIAITTILEDSGACIESSWADLLTG